MVSDVFGIKQIYPPSTRTGQIKFMPQSDPSYDPMKDRQIDVGGEGGSIKKNGGNPVESWYLTQNHQVRLNFYTSAGYSSGKIVKNHKTCADRGYMMDPKDWRDVEMSCYIYHKGGAGDDEYVWYSRGGTHTGDGNCEGCAYKADLSFSGRVRVAKEQWHVSYVFQDWKDIGIGSIKNKWVGFKFIVYNLGKGVKLEIWIDNSNADNKWNKVYEYLDEGGWGSAGAKCGGSKDQILTWGGPNATLRVDNSDGFNFKFVQISEIDPKGTFTTPPEGTGGGGTGGGGGSGGAFPGPPPPTPISDIVTAKYTDLYNINVDTGDSCTVGGPIEDRALETVENFPINPTENYVSMPLLRTRVGWFCGLDISALQGKRPRQVAVTIKRQGTPTGLIKCRIRKDVSKTLLDPGDTSVIAELGTFDSALLTNFDSTVTFTNLSNQVAIPHDGKLLVEFEGGDASNYIMVKIADQDPYDGPATNLTRYSADTNYENQKQFDMAGTIWI